jgi:D-cysteine desulfhydrase
MLLPQVNARYVRRNLLASLHAGAELLHYRGKKGLSWAVISRVVRSRLQTGRSPVFIPAGGTCPLGIIGYVSAAFELKEQVRNGTSPEPDVIYVALGSMGTAAGLALGLKAAGLRSRVVAVRVIEERVAPTNRLIPLMDRTQQLLRTLDPTFPEVHIDGDDLTIRDDFLGEGYARFTAASVNASKLLQDQGGIEANGTYTAKAFAALVHDAQQGILKDKTVLFWNTYNSRPFPDAVATMDYHLLPPAFHRYFETDVQPLDRT